MSARTRLRRLRFGLATVLGLRRRGFFIPYRYAGEVGHAGRPDAYPTVAALFDGLQDRFRETLWLLDAFAEDLRAIPRQADAPAPRWGQSWFPRLDAAVAYALVRSRRPARIVEVGSGHSTRFLAKALEDGEIAGRITAIDPAPRAALAGLPVDWRRGTLQAVGPGAAAALEEGDVLFVDSSHVLMPGSDVDLLLSEVLPRLPAGVLVHLHDVFLPDAYPAAWDWRGYNEQAALAALLFGEAWRPVFASHYVRTRMAGALAASPAAELPMPAEAWESSLWLEKTAPAAG